MGKAKVKVWKDADEVIKATKEIPKKLKWYEVCMEEIPKGEKSRLK